MGLLRALFTVAILAGIVYCGATVKLGQRTFFEHAANILRSEEAQELMDGVKESSKPVMDQLKRSVREDICSDNRDAGNDA